MGRLVALVLGAAVCFGVVEYSPMRHWLTDYQHRQEMVAYAESLRNLSGGEITELTEAAFEYNEKLRAGRLDFPGESRDTYYLGQLKANRTNVIGHVSYENLGIHLPLMLGTGDDILAVGAGHLYTTALPVGGEGNRPVLSAHSGMVGSKMFSPLLKAQPGQVFSVTTAAHTVWYEVHEVKEVLPWEVEQIEAEPGEDWVTLMTCTPIGVNTHRLLVTGHRVDGPAHPDPQILSFWTWPGPPWPLIWWSAFVALTAGVGRYFYITRPAKAAISANLITSAIQTAAGAASGGSFLPKPHLQGA